LGDGVTHEHRDERGHEPQPTTYVVEVGLADGRTLADEVVEGVGALPRFRELHQRLFSESFLAISERLIVPSVEVRFIRIRRADQ
jgi:hypothetical protein